MKTSTITHDCTSQLVLCWINTKGVENRNRLVTLNLVTAEVCPRFAAGGVALDVEIGDMFTYQGQTWELTLPANTSLPVLVKTNK